MAGRTFARLFVRDLARWPGRGHVQGVKNSLAWLAVACIACGVTVGCGSSDSGAAAPETPAPADGGGEDAGAADAEAPNPLATALDALFTETAAKDAFAGTVVVVDGGRTVMTKGYGPADRATKRPNAPDTIFRVGSVSKQFAATAILALVDDGKIKTSDPVAKYFPEYPPENLTKDGVELTLHHLLSQTSGLPDAQSTSYFKDNAWRRPIDPVELVKAASALPLVAKPGASFVYNNYNYWLLALVVQRASGKPYESFLRERFFDPLGMKDTGTVMPEASKARAAVGYYRSGTDWTSISTEPSFGDPDVTLAFGAGQIFSTAPDLATWDRALASGKLLRPDTEALLFHPNLAAYGYGWVIEKKSGVTIEWHNGALSPLGFSALIVRVPSKDRFVAYVSNLDIGVVEPLETKVEALAVK